MHIYPASKQVTSVRCQFCVYYGKEQAAGAQRARKQTVRIKTWESFRPELYESHHRGQHMDQWSIYQALDSESKKSLFEKVSPVANTLHAHFGSREKALTLYFNQEVVDVIIGQLFFNADDPNEVSRLRAISLFDLHIYDSEARAVYATTIKKNLQFRPVVKYLSHGMSFSQIELSTKTTKGLFGRPEYHDNFVIKLRLSRYHDIFLRVRVWTTKYTE